MLDMGAIKLYGPPGVFNLWDWMMSYSSMLSGSMSTISPYTITGPGSYEFTLGNGLCTTTFAEMQVSPAGCQCAPIIKDAHADCDPNPANPHGYEVTITIDNPYGSPIDVNLGMDIGPLVPFTVTVPPGSSTYVFNFTTLAMPMPPAATIWTLYNVPWGPCFDRRTINMPHCSWIPEKPGAAQPATEVNVATGMLVYPNPAAQTVSVNYVYGSESDADRRVALYDAVGRKVAERQVSGAKGAVSLSLTDLAAGAYLVRMEENGKTVHVQHLSVTK